MLGGEAASPAWTADLLTRPPGDHDRSDLSSTHYGPTETTIGVLTISGLTDGGCPADDGHARLPTPACTSSTTTCNPVPPGVDRRAVHHRRAARPRLHQPVRRSPRNGSSPARTPACERMYRTGDLARWTGEGQARVRRVAIGRTGEDPAVSGSSRPRSRRRCWRTRSVVTGRRRSPAPTGSIAYLVPADGDVHDVKGFLAGPGCREYMVPAAVVVLDALPLTANGKLDRKALPAPDYQPRPHARPARPADPRPKRGPLRRCSREVLGLDTVGVDDDFFDLGRALPPRHRGSSRGSGRCWASRSGSGRCSRPRPSAGLAARLTSPTAAPDRAGRGWHHATAPGRCRCRSHSSGCGSSNQLEGPSATYNVPMVTPRLPDDGRPVPVLEPWR